MNKQTNPVPRILVIDDLLGRQVAGIRNEERADMCITFSVQDVTGDQPRSYPPPRIRQPVAEAIFCRGQTPACARVGDVVRNDLAGTLRLIETGWTSCLPGESPWAMVLLDLCFLTGEVTQANDAKQPGVATGQQGDNDPRSYFGLEVLRAVHSRWPDLPVVILSSMPRSEVSEEFARHGALAFLERTKAGDRAGELRQHLWRHGLLPEESGAIVGRSRALLLALRQARRLAMAGNWRSLLVRGENGTGKDVFVRTIHNYSDRAGKPFVNITCTALPEQLLESELFGHVRGAFTGAVADKQGLFQSADGGTVFLDEIGDMPLGLQAKLLRVLEEHAFRPVGAEADARVDVRVIAATNRDLDEDVRLGAFRKDLYFRMSEVGVIELPPLRRRKEDIPLLADRFVRQAQERYGDSARRRDVHALAIEAMERYDWPGNVRQLRNCILEAVTNNPDVEHLMPVHLRMDAGTSGADRTQPAVPGHQRREVRSGSLEQLLELDALTIDAADLRGSYPRVATLLLRLLRAAVEATRKATNKVPEGEMSITRAASLLAGKDLRTSAAADFVKKLFAISHEVGKEQMQADSVLREVYDKAHELRPPSTRRSADRSSG
jgi:DNA-binding NtrC family response regulator